MLDIHDTGGMLFAFPTGQQAPLWVRGYGIQSIPHW